MVRRKISPLLAASLSGMASLTLISGVQACGLCSNYALSHNPVSMSAGSVTGSSQILGSVASSTISSSIATDSLIAGTPGGLQFNLVEVPNEITANVRNGFITAANYWSSVVADAGFTVNLQIGFRDLGTGVLGSTGSNQTQQSYSDFRNAIVQKRTSADDFQAASSLQSGDSFAMLLNGTANNPNGVGSRTPYVDNDGDANNTTIRATTANARALGLSVTYGTGDNSFDGLITFSSRFAFDFDSSDGITAGMYDFVGVATHEIGHALGFISGVNVLDNFNANGNYQRDDQLTYVSPVDIFRYTALSAVTNADGLTGTPGIPNFTLGTYSPDFTPGGGTLAPVNQYFSLDNGATSMAPLATGRNFGDGQQASHWKDNLTLGIMDPTSSPGERARFSVNDLRLFDVIGYTLRPGALESVSAPEPGSLAIIFFSGTLLFRSSGGRLKRARHSRRERCRRRA